MREKIITKEIAVRWTNPGSRDEFLEAYLTTDQEGLSHLLVDNEMHCDVSIYRFSRPATLKKNVSLVDTVLAGVLKKSPRRLEKGGKKKNV